MDDITKLAIIAVLAIVGLMAAYYFAWGPIDAGLTRELTTVPGY